MVVASRSGQADSGELLTRLRDLGEREGLDLDVSTVDGEGTVIEALSAARHDVAVVMNADRGHPPEAIPALLTELDAGYDLVIGSRYVEGGRDAGDRGVLRWCGRVLTRALARPLSTVKDPTSGFLAMRRAAIEPVQGLDPTGRALALELLVKGRVTSVAEVPIRVGPPRAGRAPIGVVRHVRRLYIHRFGVWSDFAHFAAVGASGTVVNLGCLTALVAIDVPERIALAVAIAVSMFSNFLLNRHFTFAGAHLQPFFRQLAGFVAACSLGALVNYAVAAAAHTYLLPQGPIQVSALMGIAAGTLLNFVINRFVVFRIKRTTGSGHETR